MQLVPVAYLPPGVCFICEGRPGEGEQVVDTGMNFEPGYPLKITGRKYLCNLCVAAAAVLFGFETGAQVEQAKIELAEANRQLTVLSERATLVAKAILGDGNVVVTAEDGTPVPFDKPKTKKAASVSKE